MPELTAAQQKKVETRFKNAFVDAALDEASMLGQQAGREFVRKKQRELVKQFEPMLRKALKAEFQRICDDAVREARIDF